MVILKLKIKELLKSLEYDTSEKSMTVKKVNDFLEGLNEKEEYEIENAILTDEEIAAYRNHSTA